jgi:hypothetical protein
MKARDATPEGDSLLRKTGISLASHMPWGAHLCIFYETAADLLDICVRYFEAGLESNEVCVWAVSDPITVDDALSGCERALANSTNISPPERSKFSQATNGI